MGKWWLKAYWFVAGFVKKYKKTVLLSLLGAGFVAGFVGWLWPRMPKPRKTVYVGIVGRYSLSQIPREIEDSLGVGLTEVGADKTVVPGAAMRWEIADEGKVYRFYLRDGLTWSDGKKLVLSDLEFNIPEVEVVKEDPNVIEFRLPEPFAPFPAVVSKPLIRDGVQTLSKYQIKDIKTEGPYLEELSIEGEDGGITFRSYDTVNQATLAFKLGEVDKIVGLPTPGDLADWPNTKVSQEESADSYVAVFYNTEDDWLSDKAIRQALSYAIEDKTQGYERALGPISGDSWVYNGTIKAYEYSESRAKELLTSALPEDGELAIELSASPEFLELAEEIKEDWEAIGVKVTIKVVSSVPSDFQAMVLVQDIPDDPDQYSYWHSTQAGNITHLKSPRVDKALEDGRQEVLSNARREIYFDFQRFLVEDSPATFLYYPADWVIERR